LPEIKFDKCPIPLECHLSHIEIDSNNAVDVLSSDKDEIKDEVSGDDLKDALDLKLQIGVFEANRFTPITSSMPIGEQVRVALSSNNTNYNFALFGCFAYAGAPLLDTEDLESRDYIQLYSNDSNTDIDSCPNDNAKKLGLVRDSADTFDVPVFQITGSTHLSMYCSSL